MRARYPELVASCDRLSDRLIMLALDCPDDVTRQKLLALVSVCVEGTGPRERVSAPQDEMITISGWRH